MYCKHIANYFTNFTQNEEDQTQKMKPNPEIDIFFILTKIRIRFLI